MNKDDILKEFDTLAEAKRKGCKPQTLFGFCPARGGAGSGMGAGSELFGTG